MTSAKEPSRLVRTLTLRSSTSLVTPGKHSAANTELEEKAVPATTVAKFSSPLKKIGVCLNQALQPVNLYEEVSSCSTPTLGTYRQ
jgi:hypothetical protein